jgi:hypothetical protein
MTPILDRLGLYRNIIIGWFVSKALERLFADVALTTEEITAIEAELDAQLLAEETP